VRENAAGPNAYEQALEKTDSAGRATSVPARWQEQTKVFLPSCMITKSDVPESQLSAAMDGKRSFIHERPFQPS
jgi:hypothetical protein